MDCCISDRYQRVREREMGKIEFDDQIHSGEGEKKSDGEAFSTSPVRLVICKGS